MKTTITLCFLLLVGALNAQQLVTKVGRTTSRFNYEDSQGQGLANQQAQQRFCYELGYRHKIGSRWYPGASFTYRRYSVSSTIPEYDTQLQWDTQYVGFKVGMDGQLFSTNGWTFMLGVGAGPQFMTSGTQKINEEVYGLAKTEQFDKTLWSYQGALGVNYCMDERIAVLLEYSYGSTTTFGKTDDPESLRINAHYLSLGLLVSLGKCDFCSFNSLKSTR
ncbi:MAG: outer membrane beta-barrel protein [Flavobacteriales bacterium]|nr:outer membrane beta-barrel protein [Flavobacteriales bacterium]